MDEAPELETKETKKEEGPAPEQAAPSEVDPLQAMAAERERLAEQYAALHDQLLRKQADFENYRKRVERERQDYRHQATMEVVREILPVMDNLERALLAGREKGNEDSGVMKGVDLTLRMFQVVLEKFGVTRIKAAGEPFDPHRHEAIMQSESPEVVVETVAEELEPGYVMRGRVVRPARVRVLKPKPAAEAA